MPASKYGIDIEQLSAHGQAAVRAAEQLAARTTIFRDQVPLAAIIPVEDLDKLEPRDPGEGGADPLLSLCGKCDNDAFVDHFNSELSQTALFHPAGSSSPPRKKGSVPPPPPKRR
jgi:hypothetical protein